MGLVKKKIAIVVRKKRKRKIAIIFTHGTV